VAEITRFLNDTRDKFDLVVAADVFVYMGNLKPVFRAVQKRSFKGTYFVFSTENSTNSTYVCRKNGRFAHGKSYIQSMARKHGFKIKECKAIDIRKEMGDWVKGELYFLEYCENVIKEI